MINEQELYKRIRGVLIGCAVGDAMGMPTECWSQEKINRFFPSGVNEFMPSNENDIMGRKMKKGEITDDTINTVMIIETIVESQGNLDVNFYVEKLRYWNKNSGVSGYVSGPSTLRALKKIEEGVSIEETGIMGTTNGASMKITPIGVVSDYKDMKQLVKNVYQICLPTHNTKIAIAGASAVSAVISYVIQGGKDIEEIWKIAYQGIEAAKDYGFDFPAASLKFRMQAAREIVLNNTEEEAIKKLYNEIGTGLETIETIPCVFAVIELANKDPMKAAIISANLGWDTDTIGAISAAICGGINPDFKSEIVDLIEKTNDLNFKKLSESLLPFCTCIKNKEKKF
ncbi:MAG: ADP-ribosylglycohydrolase family protein [Fusobacteriaceae bacterium]